MLRKEKKFLVVADPAHCFWSCGGMIFKDLRDLRGGLSSMRDENFRYHVSKDKNDFARWVREVLKDVDLGNKLMKTKTRTGALRAVESHLRADYGV